MVARLEVKPDGGAPEFFHTGKIVLQVFHNLQIDFVVFPHGVEKLRL